MRYQSALALLLCLLFAACKKTTESPQGSTTPTSDFRSDVVGEYRLTYREITYWHPDMKPKDTTETSLTDDVTISYSISDSTQVTNSYNYRDTLVAAIKFTWHTSGKVELYGMLDSTHLSGKGRYSDGLFINKDSIAYYKSESGVSFDWRAYINGRRK